MAGADEDEDLPACQAFGTRAKEINAPTRINSFSAPFGAVERHQPQPPPHQQPTSGLIQYQVFSFLFCGKKDIQMPSALNILFY